MRAAASFGAAGDVDRAVEEYQAVAAMTDVDKRLADLAKLRMIMIRSDVMEPTEMLEGLQPLSAVGEPWRSLALEFTAAAHVRNNDSDAAVDALSTLVSDENTTPAVQARAREMIAALGGTAPATVTPAASLDAETVPDGDDSESETQ